MLVGLSYFLFGDAGALGPNQVALVVATMIAVFIGVRRGHSMESLREAAVQSVGSGIGALFILLAVGTLIGAWALSGTLLAMVYYGLQLLNPNYFYVTATAVCAIVAARESDEPAGALARGAADAGVWSGASESSVVRASRPITSRERSGSRSIVSPARLTGMAAMAR